MAIKRLIISALCMIAVLATASCQDLYGWLSTQIGMKPIKTTKVEGGFDSHVQIADPAIPYSEYTVFSNDDYPVKYYSIAKATSTKATGSVIDVFGESFPVGSNSQELSGKTSPDIVIPQARVFQFSHGGRNYMYIVSPVGGSAYYQMINLFDITEREHIQYYYFQTWLQYENLLVGDYGEDGAIDIAVISQGDTGDADWQAELYTVENGRMVARRGASQKMALLFDWDRRKPSEMRLVSKNF